MGYMIIYLQQWDIWQVWKFISHRRIYDNLSQTMVYMTIHLVKEASRHGLPLLLGENGVDSDLLNWSFDHIWGSFLECSCFDNHVTLVLRCLLKRNLFPLSYNYWIYKAMYHRGLNWCHLHVQEHHPRVGAFSPFTNRRRRNTRNTPEFFHLSFRFSPQLYSFNVIVGPIGCRPYSGFSVFPSSSSSSSTLVFFSCPH